MNRKYYIEKLISIDEKVEISISELIQIYDILKLERFPIQNHHDRNWHSEMVQYSPQVQDPIISFSSKSIILGLNKDQVCKIRLDGNAYAEIKNIDAIKNKTSLFPEVYFTVDLINGLKGIIMERITNVNKFNFTSGELNRLYFNFRDEIDSLHKQGILHNDLDYGINSKIRPNLIISNDRIRLLDFESIKIQQNTDNWEQLMENELVNLNNYFSELIDFALDTLT
jgi:predicted Ser/Thr protein kinase